MNDQYRPVITGSTVNATYHEWLVGIITASLMTNAVSDQQIEMLVRVAIKAADEVINQTKKE